MIKMRKPSMLALLAVCACQASPPDARSRLVEMAIKQTNAEVPAPTSGDVIDRLSAILCEKENRNKRECYSDAESMVTKYYIDKVIQTTERN